MQGFSKENYDLLFLSFVILQICTETETEHTAALTMNFFLKVKNNFLMIFIIIFWKQTERFKFNPLKKCGC